MASTQKPTRTVQETVTYQIPISTYERLEIDLSQVLAVAEEEGVKPHQLRIESSRLLGLMISWTRPTAEERG